MRRSFLNSSTAWPDDHRNDVLVVTRTIDGSRQCDSVGVLRRCGRMSTNRSVLGKLILDSCSAIALARVMWGAITR